jgi:branched-subunit amino acid ABC-type transport system permease component
MLLFYQVAISIRLSLTICRQVVELQPLQDDNKLLEQLVTSLLSSTTLQQVVNKLATNQCEHIPMTSFWNSIATSLLVVC